MGKRQYRELDDVVKQKISQSMRGRSKSESHKEHISNGLKQYWKHSIGNRYRTNLLMKNEVKGGVANTIPPL